MRRNTTALLMALSFAGFAVRPAAADPPVPATLDVDVSRPGAAIPPTFYGLMTEEINHSYDGGLFAELIQNRTFQDDAKRPVHWSLAAGSGPAAAMRMDGGDPVTAALPVSLRLDLGGGRAGSPTAATGGSQSGPTRPTRPASTPRAATGSPAR